MCEWEPHSSVDLCDTSEENMRDATPFFTPLYRYMWHFVSLDDQTIF